MQCTTGKNNAEHFKSVKNIVKQCSGKQHNNMKYNAIRSSWRQYHKIPLWHLIYREKVQHIISLSLQSSDNSCDTLHCFLDTTLWRYLCAARPETVLVHRMPTIRGGVNCTECNTQESVHCTGCGPRALHVFPRHGSSPSLPLSLPLLLELRFVSCWDKIVSQ